ncbi:MAG: hypothetical protein PHS45_04485 [Bacilli bacterium]|nr:hypothetical protein [Bacilli bacterium]
MNKIKNIKKKYALNVDRYTIKKGVVIADTREGRFVFKENNNNNIEKLYNYLDSRSFYHYGPLINSDNNYNIYRYLDSVDMPREQKALDLMYLLSLLHNKTTYYKEVDIDDYKEIYEDINNKIETSYQFYNNFMESAESKVYMSPTEYLLARNVNKVYGSLVYCKYELKKWYELIKDNRKKRVVTLHNNLELDHLIKKDEAFLISWEASKEDMPFYDLYDFYKKHYLELDFVELFKTYESKYPLLEEERKLLFVLLSLPEIIDLDNTEYLNCKVINTLLEYIYKTEQLILNYHPTEEVNQTT